MHLLVGLGNPGNEYQHTYHNAGFIVIDVIAKAWSFSSFLKKFDSLLSVRTINSDKVMLLKPYSFMNNSGKPLLQILNFYKIPLDNVVVMHDDADLKSGSVKIKKGGGSAGHNGIKSLDNFIGSNYWRLRIGIGRPENKDDLANYVLSKCSNIEDINSLANKIAINIKLLLDDKLSFIKSLA
ncbi:MAG: peptidyl-tRNA hydrolase [Candidatus Mesenet longicola]|uniref:Peptidyl-tRNA hydrolase n=1 Tax=Candidatus Mesenet longicola TaxID=1892558 RepID=A0A8J3HXJ6_9RICK|nr:MAG: peptidyl-tRNA hydrolase [Candidatus Mesenet longicola]GHM60116.1 MAG: peptidyl-tRNA hydrolase [Candidatus Mesenet longicola]